MQPWLSSVNRFEELDVENLVSALFKYKRYLTSHAEQTKSRQHSLEPPTHEDETSLITLPGNGSLASPVYISLEQQLSKMEMYQPLFVNDIAPHDRLHRRRWLSGIQLPFSVMIYKYAYGNNLGTLTYASRIPEDEQVDATVVSRIFSRLNDQQSTYYTCAIRQDFMDRYRRLAKIPTMVLRNIHRTLLNDSSSAKYSSQSVVDERVAQAI